METFQGTVDRVTYHDPATGWSVASLRVAGRAELLPVVGMTTGLFPGQELIVRGDWETHTRWGRQFRFQEYEPLRPTTAHAMAAYLASDLFKGIGPKTAAAIVACFGEDTLDVLDHEPQRLKEAGIGRRRAEALHAAWQDQHEAHRVMIFLQRYGLGGALAARIYQRYHGQAIEVVERDPYRLAREITGIGFLTADRLAQQLGLEPTDPSRIQAGLLHVLERAVGSDGHLYLPRERLLIAACKLLEVEPELVEHALYALAEADLVVMEEDDGAVWLPDMLAAEREIADRLLGLLATGVPLAPDDRQLTDWLARRAAFGDTELTGEQAEAVGLALSEGLSVITGGPGTGKTTVVRAVTDACETLGRRVGLACPTGRAAKRLQQLAGKPASTIHRLLAYDPQRHAFRHNESNPLPYDFLVIDEASMVDVPLARDLLRALPAGAQLLLVGDADQLPSVGPGNFLRDVVDSEVVPVSRLTQIHRQQQDSLIVRNAHAINHGERPELVQHDQWLRQRGDFLFFPENHVELAADLVIRTATQSLPRMGFSPTDIQVLTPMRRGLLGVMELNRRLQETFNPPHAGRRELTRGEIIFRQGDRVLQTVNNYDKGVYNGDIGFIQVVDPAEGTILVEYDQGPVSYGRAELDELQLAYALTVHKSQGSEYPACVIVLHTTHYIMLQRNLLYTALTRAQRMCCLVGEARAIFRAMNTYTGRRRHTKLAARLRS